MHATSKRKLATAVALALALPFMAVKEASAHTVAIGWSNGANAGQVNLFMGSYHQDNIGDGPNIEGSAHLTGPGAYDTTSPFTTAYVTGALPGSLPIGNVNFASGWSLASINSWEAVTMTGLTTAGTYNFDYVCGAGCSAHWSPIISNIAFNFSAVDLGGGGQNVGNVPEPATLALLGLGLAGLGFSRRSKQKTA